MANYFIILWWFLPYIDMNQPWLYMCPPVLNPLLPASPPHPSGLSQSTGFECPASCIELGLVIFHIWQYTCFNVILSNHPTLTFSHRVQKSVLYICVSLAVSCPSYCKQGCDEHWGTCVSFNSCFLSVCAQQWECKLVQPLWRTVWRFLKNWK